MEMQKHKNVNFVIMLVHFVMDQQYKIAKNLKFLFMFKI